MVVTGRSNDAEDRVAKLKASLSEYLATVKSGDEVLITERGHPIARIVPVSGPGPSVEGLDRLVRAGLIRRPEVPLDRRFWKLARPADPKGAARATLIADREESR